MNNAEPMHVSLGRLADRLGVPTDKALQAVRSAAVRPSMWLDDTPYFHSEHVNTIREALKP